MPTPQAPHPTVLKTSLRAVETPVSQQSQGRSLMTPMGINDSNTNNRQSNKKASEEPLWLEVALGPAVPRSVLSWLCCCAIGNICCCGLEECC
ncbi:hypothetical protein IAR50_002396 [Cryptococcus sp. DSM 104548]